MRGFGYVRDRESRAFAIKGDAESSHPHPCPREAACKASPCYRETPAMRAKQGEGRGFLEGLGAEAPQPLQHSFSISASSSLRKDHSPRKGAMG